MYASEDQLFRQRCCRDRSRSGRRDVGHADEPTEPVDKNRGPIASGRTEELEQRKCGGVRIGVERGNAEIPSQEYWPVGGIGDDMPGF